MKYVAAAFKIQVGFYVSTVCLCKKRQTVVCFFSVGSTEGASVVAWKGSCPSYVVLKLKHAVSSLWLCSAGESIGNLSRPAKSNPFTVYAEMQQITF